ncbi:MAG: hypothetical protein HY926_11100 [Elusimicrobia bacterium]|nr:hypothetical protein [Elusimicrobiota bacterium]
MIESLRMAPRFDLVCVGLSVVDVLAQLGRPLREDEKIPAERIIVDGGGPAGTCGTFDTAGAGTGSP